MSTSVFKNEFRSNFSYHKMLTFYVEPFQMDPKNT